MKVMATIAIAMMLACAAVAQSGACTEQNIRRMHMPHIKHTYSAEAYFFSGAFDKPIVGAAKLEQSTRQVKRTRQNEKDDPEVPEKIVASADGSMAYEYGTIHSSFDEVATGKHIDFQAAYLQVWKAEDGQCKIGASMFQPIGPK